MLGVRVCEGLGLISAVSAGVVCSKRTHSTVIASVVCSKRTHSTVIAGVVWRGWKWTLAWRCTLGLVGHVIV